MYRHTDTHTEFQKSLFFYSMGLKIVNSLKFPYLFFIITIVSQIHYAYEQLKRTSSCGIVSADILLVRLL